ncbi:MAG TPA: IPT/TIG domain-containing protein [Acidimicrobiales bacterium]|nr:IPT/TIG domain-containing protein [Acidimicrobiales bacterium]
MARKLTVGGVVSAMMLLGVVSAAGAATATPLLLPPSTAFSVLGHSCGGIQEQAFATGFDTTGDATNGFPMGDVHLQTTCAGSGRGGRSTTYSAWVGVTWDFTGAVVSSAVLSSAPAVDPTFSAVDGYGNEISNSSNNAYLVLGPTFVPVPRVTGISLNVGPASGGTSVTITGTGFTGATAVDFGSAAAASFVVVGDTSITAVSPATGPGTVDVTVTTAGGPSAPSTIDQFTFVAAPSVSALSPNSGPIDGGTTVTITGANFTGATMVEFGGTAVGFTVNDDTSITVVSPPGEEVDTVDVTVTTPGGTSPTGPSTRFAYTLPTPAVSVSPAAGPVRTVVGVSGQGFSPGETVKVGYGTGLGAGHPASVALCKTQAGDDGTFFCTGTIPGKATAGAMGAHTVVSKGTTSRITATTVFTLT